MELQSGDILIFTIGDTIKKCRISSVDGRIVKLFEEDGTYNQIPYSNLMGMFYEGCVKKEKNESIEEF